MLEQLLLIAMFIVGYVVVGAGMTMALLFTSIRYDVEKELEAHILVWPVVVLVAALTATAWLMEKTAVPFILYIRDKAGK